MTIIELLLVLILSRGAGTLISKKIRYSLVKSNRFTNFKVLKKPDMYDTIRKKTYNVNITKETQQIINKLYDSFEPLVSKESMEIIKRNIESINVNSNFLKSLKMSFISAGGTYEPSDHSINENYLLTKVNIAGYIEGRKLFSKIISHELMHAASSFKNDKQIIVGFSQRYNNMQLNIGNSINEGYTQLLADEYLIDKNLKITGKNVAYDYEVSAAKLVELIVGKDKMINMYFHGDLEGLIKELSKYQDEIKVKRFILDLDMITNIRKDRTSINKNSIINNYYNRVNIFLYNAFSNKMINNRPEEYLRESKKFLELFLKIEKNYPIKKKIKKEIKK